MNKIILFSGFQNKNQMKIPKTDLFLMLDISPKCIYISWNFCLVFIVTYDYRVLICVIVTTYSTLCYIVGTFTVHFNFHRIDYRLYYLMSKKKIIKKIILRFTLNVKKHSWARGLNLQSLPPSCAWTRPTLIKFLHANIHIPVGTSK